MLREWNGGIVRIAITPHRWGAGPDLWIGMRRRGRRIIARSRRVIRNEAGLALITSEGCRMVVNVVSESRLFVELAGREFENAVSMVLRFPEDELDDRGVECGRSAR